MSKTKQKILVKSLDLFNDSGVSEISLRDIATELKISVGNLQYHFKKREDIIEAIYFQLVEEIDSIFFADSNNLLESFFKVSTELASILFEYRFFLLDFVSITRNNPEIKKHYSALSAKRETETLQVVNHLIECDLLRAEQISKEYSSLFKRVEVISNFWFSSVLIQKDKLSTESLHEYTLLISQSIYPYLTEQGRREYATLFPEQEVDC